MQVAEVHAYYLDHKLATPFESASARYCLVEVICDDGTTGWGNASA